MEFPRWMYHRTQEAVIVKDSAEQAALGKGWETSPTAFELPEAREEPKGKTSKGN